MFGTMENIYVCNNWVKSILCWRYIIIALLLISCNENNERVNSSPTIPEKYSWIIGDWYGEYYNNGPSLNLVITEDYVQLFSNCEKSDDYVYHKHILWRRKMHIINDTLFIRDSYKYEDGNVKTEDKGFLLDSERKEINEIPNDWGDHALLKRVAFNKDGYIDKIAMGLSNIDENQAEDIDLDVNTDTLSFDEEIDVSNAERLENESQVNTSLETFSEAEEDEDEPKGQEILGVAEQMPEFPDGGMDGLMKWLSNNIQYPADARERGIQGRVTMNFVVNRDGSISDVQVLRGVDLNLDKEAARLINSMPKWKPGMQHGKPVRVRCTVPINFKIQ